MHQERTTPSTRHHGYAWRARPASRESSRSARTPRLRRAARWAVLVASSLAFGCSSGDGAETAVDEASLDPCGDGLCSLDGEESCMECPEDCGPCVHAECGDGTCEEDGGETCSSCAEDCGPCVDCGDGICDLSQAESCSSCPGDCGACDPCGDETCDEPSESCDSCPADCGDCEACGDGVCDELTETCTSCPEDCEACEVRAGCVQGSFEAFHGNLHSHTSYSDGVRTPAHAFAAARDAGLDFMWVTDHKGPMGGKLADCKAQAATANAVMAGEFVAGCGYEVDLWNASHTRRFGHFNALFLPHDTKTPAGLQDMYSTLAGCDPCIGQWNHPPWPETFDDYRFFPVGKPAMRLIELSGGGAWGQKMGAYFQALRNGWKVSPACNEDNHKANWGKSPRATGVWATRLARPALRKAIQANRTFATFDDTARIAFKADGSCWMGSHLRGLGPIELSVTARDPQGSDRFERIDLLGTHGNVLASKPCTGSNPCKATFTRNPSEATFWVAQAVQRDGDVLVSAPIWLEP